MKKTKKIARATKKRPSQKPKAKISRGKKSIKRILKKKPQIKWPTQTKSAVLSIPNIETVTTKPEIEIKEEAPINNNDNINTATTVTQPSLSEPEAIIIEPKISEKKNLRPSRHIIDLKKIQQEKELLSRQTQSRQEMIYQEVVKSLQHKKSGLIKNFKNTYTSVSSSLQKREPNLKKIIHHYPEEEQIPSLIKTSEPIKIKTSKIKSPRFRLPSIKFQLPDLELPRFKLPEIRLGNLTLPQYSLKPIAAFILLCFILTAPFNIYANYQKLQGKKDDVLDKTKQALLHLTTSTKAASAKDFYYTQHELEKSAGSFMAAQKELNDVNLVLQNLIKLAPSAGQQFATAQKLLNAGVKMTQSAALLTKTVDRIQTETDSAKRNLNDNLILVKDALNLVLPDMQTVAYELQQINIKEIPAEYQDKIIILQQTLPMAVNSVQTYINTADLLVQTLGHDSPKRYLLLFQNNNELRPTGGFIGSFALADIDRGNIKKLEIPGGGPYDLKAGLKINLEAPHPLQIMNPRWEFQDGNWFADLPASAQKLIYLYEKSGGPTVDGILFINASVLKGILELTGPVDLPQYNLQITSTNFYKEIQNNVELDYDKEINKPKQIITDLTPILIDRLLHSSPQNFAKMFDLIFSALNQKEIQLYFTDMAMEDLVKKYNWAGQVKNTNYDYLNIVSTNIAGEKTDAKIQQAAELKIQVQTDGTIVNTLKLTRNHLGIKGENFYGVPNVDYLRIFVPKDSELISAEGFEPIPPELFIDPDPEIYKKDADISEINKTKKIDPASQTEIFTESDKTVFANWLKVNPGEAATLTIKYKLPFKLNLEADLTGNLDFTNFKNIINSILRPEEIKEKLTVYSLLWQKQSGRDNFLFNATIEMPKAFDYKFIYPENLQSKGNNVNLSGSLDVDKFIAVIFKP